MPNGYTGEFLIDCNKVRQLLAKLPPDAIVGRRFGQGTSIVTVAQLMLQLDQQAKPHVPVEIQEHSWYIAHLGEDCGVCIGGDSPLYEAFHRRHSG
jgi:hypothetical protein